MDNSAADLKRKNTDDQQQEKEEYATTAVLDYKEERRMKKQYKKELQKQEKRRKEMKEFEDTIISTLRNNTLTKLDRSLSDDQAKAVGLALMGNTSLEQLTLRFKHYIKNPSLALPGVQALCDGILMSKLNKFAFFDSIVDAKICQCLYQTVQDSSTLTTLSVSLYEHTYSDEENMIALGRALMNNTTLRELSLCIGCNLTDDGAEALSLGLQHSPILKLEISFSNVGFYNSTESEVALGTIFEGVQQKMQSLQVLTISDIDSYFPFTCVADGLRATTSLKELVIKDGFMDVSDLRVLSQALHQNNSVTILRLNGDTINDEGLIELANNLRPDSCLEELHLNGDPAFQTNKFGLCGVQSLVRAVTNTPALQKLNLSGNSRIGYQGWKVIGDELPNLTLRELDLRAVPQVRNHRRHDDDDDDDDRIDDSDDSDADRSDDNQDTNWRKLSRRAFLQGMRENEHICKLLLHEGAYKRREFFDELYFYADRNLWGRRLLTVDHGLPSTIWCYILDRAQKGNENEPYHDSRNAANLVYYILCQQPHLVQVFR